MPWKEDELRQHLAGDALKPVYLLAGAEPLHALEAADALRARARQLGYAEREVLEAGESSFDWNRLAQAGASLSLFAQRRLIDLRLPSGKAGKEGGDAITEFCRQPAPDTVLLITTMEWSKKHQLAWCNAVDRAGASVVFWPVRRNDLPRWVAQRASTRGLRLSRDAIALLIERTEGNLFAAAQEIDKAALLAGGDPAKAGGGAQLDAAGLGAIVADSARFDVFDLMDSALAGETARALRIVDNLRAEGAQVPGIVPWMATQLQLMVKLAAAVQSGTPVDAALKAAYVWQEREVACRRALQRGGLAFWEARLAEVARVEKMGKGRIAGDAWRELARLVAAVSDTRIADGLQGARRAAGTAMPA